MKIMESYNDAEVAYWGDLNPSLVTFGPPSGMTNCTPAAAVVTEPDSGTVVRVGWKPDEIDLAHLAQGGIVWLSMWGGLAPHMIEVSEPIR